VGELSAALLVEAESGAPALYLILDLALPSGTRRYSNIPIKSAAFGQYQGRVVSFGNLFRGVSNTDGSLVFPRLGDMTVEDVDGSLAEALELTEPGGSIVTIRLASPNVAAAEYYTLVGNFRLDDWRQDRALVWTLVCSYYDLPLRSPFPHMPILRPDFPNVADPVTYTYHGYVAYGVHHSGGVGDKGMVPTLYVDTVTGDFGPFLGWVTVERVFKNDVIQSGWTTVHTIKNGRLWTLIRLAAPPPVGEVVTADITGYRAGTDGAGSVLTGADALKHLLVNWVYPTPLTDWKRDAWLPDSTAPVHTTRFAEMQAFLVAQGWEKVSKVFGGPTRVTGEAAVNDFLSSFGKVGSIGAFVSNDGKIALRPNDHTTTTLYHSGARWLRYNRHEHREDGSWKRWNDRTQLADRINVSFLPRAVDESYRWSIEVQDLAAGRNAGADLTLPWSNAQLE
jgi:hypothetical protein